MIIQDFSPDADALVIEIQKEDEGSEIVISKQNDNSLIVTVTYSDGMTESYAIGKQLETTSDIPSI